MTDFVGRGPRRRDEGSGRGARTLEVYDFNPRARHVYEKVGCRHEGTGRGVLLFDGEWIDVRYMAVLAHDLPAEVTA